MTSEKDAFSFFALFAALFSIKVLSGFFLFCFLLSLPLLMIVNPHLVRVDSVERKVFSCSSVMMRRIVLPLLSNIEQS